MALKLYMDVHVPSAITAGLQRRGVDVVTSQEDGTTQYEDSELLERAGTMRRLLFTQDEDLLRIATSYQRAGRPFGGVIYAHQLNAGIGQLVDDLELASHCCTADELRNRVLYLPLR